MSHSSRSKKNESVDGASKNRSGKGFSDEKTKSSSQKQTAAFRRWNQSAMSESSVEEQISRANAIAEMDISEFIPQSFVSKRLADEEKAKSIGQKEVAPKALTGMLAGPVENLINPALLPKTEEERNKMQAQMLTSLRKEIFEKRNVIAIN